MTLFDHKLIESPTVAYARLREGAAVHRTTTAEGEPAWLITRYREARALLTDGRISLDKANAKTSGSYQSSMPPELDAHLLNMDPPDHTRLRRLIARAFTPRRIAGLRCRIQVMTDALLATRADPRIDLMEVLAVPLPMGVICELLGVPEDNRHDFRAWTDTLLSPTAGSAQDSRTAMRQMHQFLTGVIQAKRSHPAEDLLSALVHARDDHDSLSEHELLSLAFLTLFAGYDNAVHLIGNAVLGLLLHPPVMHQVRQGTLPVQAVIEETLRWNPPFPLGVRRFALGDIAIDDTVIPAGGRVWISIASANRDDREFPSPDSFAPGPPLHPPGVRPRHSLLPRRATCTTGSRDRYRLPPGALPRPRARRAPRGPSLMALLPQTRSSRPAGTNTTTEARFGRRARLMPLHRRAITPGR